MYGTDATTHILAVVELRQPAVRVARILIRRLSRDNPFWGALRIQAEVHLLGHDLARSALVPIIWRTDWVFGRDTGYSVTFPLPLRT